MFGFYVILTLAVMFIACMGGVFGYLIGKNIEEKNMSMQICKEAYQELIDGDIEWLIRQPRDLERDHIEEVLRKSVELLCGKEE